jgi:F-type H+-transporting ATPase subunit epsilon
MTSGLHLIIATPAKLLIDVGNVRSLRAEDDSGAFGLLPGHADLLTVLPPSVVRWSAQGGSTSYCALSGGVLRVAGGTTVAIACRRGVIGSDLSGLRGEIEAMRLAELDADRRARVEQTRLHARALRQLMRYLKPGGQPLGEVGAPFTGDGAP